MFNIGIYKGQMNLIALLLFILIIVTAFKERTPATAPQTLVQSAATDSGYAPGRTQETLRPREYQVELLDDFIVIYDGNRVVGTLTYRTSLGRMMMKDNE